MAKETRPPDPVTVILLRLLERVHGRPPADARDADVATLLQELRAASTSGALQQAFESDIWAASLRNELRSLTTDDGLRRLLE